MRYILLVPIIILVSCTTAKVVQISSNDLAESKKGYVFENDSVRITYRFWTLNGRMDYDIYNKLNVPLYIDWKTSAYIPNDKMVSYWRDETNIESVSNAYYFGNFGGGKAKTKSVRMERVAVIPPQSMITQNSFKILKGYSDIPEKGSYSISNSPFRFRNYITIAGNEKFEGKTSTVNNSFYISSIQVIKDSKLGNYESEGWLYQKKDY